MRIDESFIRQHDEHWKPDVEAVAKSNGVSYRDVIVAVKLLAQPCEPDIRSLFEWRELQRHLQCDLDELSDATAFDEANKP